MVVDCHALTGCILQHMQCKPSLSDTYLIEGWQLVSDVPELSS